MAILKEKAVQAYLDYSKRVFRKLYDETSPEDINTTTLATRRAKIMAATRDHVGIDVDYIRLTPTLLISKEGMYCSQEDLQQKLENDPNSQKDLIII